ncbi:MAG: NAD(P)H-dependent oxidoreductase [Elusimicrobia bacterium]|nr:NAD(P)H-dependent oxidoreductase [Elusimicrobiota bacterium]
MRHLVLYCHPDPKSLNHAIFEAVVEELRGLGHEVVERDLYQTGFSPILRSVDLARLAAGEIPEDIQAEQDEIRAADCLVFIFPIWWTGMPAMLKGYIDRVFSPGFAFSVAAEGPQGLLAGKRALVFNTTAFPETFYRQAGLAESLDANLAGGILRFCGVEVAAHKYCWGVPFTDNEERQAQLAEIRELVRAEAAR